jgi:hypothetical protein
MKKYAILLFPVSILFGVSVVISSCNNDEPAKPKLSFSKSTLSVTEGVGTINAELILDKAASKDLTVSYTLSGTAVNAEDNPIGADYDVDGGSGEVVIKKGEKSATIDINVDDDKLFEDDETIIIKIDKVSLDNVEITTDDQMEITVKNDDSKVKATMAVATASVSEDDGATVFEIAVNLDQAAPADLLIKYTVTGTAIDSLTGAKTTPNPVPPQYYDYYIDGKLGELTIAKGQTSGKIRIFVYTDFQWENDETIIITLTDGGSAVDLGDQKVTTATLLQQDGKAIYLKSDNSAVDMDLFLWIGNDVNSLVGPIASSASGGTNPEALIIPAVVGDLAFGLSLTWYSGGTSPMTFKVQYIDFVDGTPEAEASRDIFTGTYTTANINPWDTSNSAPQIEQTFVKASGAITNISAITPPASGSRVRTTRMPSQFKKESLRASYIPRGFRK